MMIASPTTSDRYAAAAAFDRSLRSADSDGGDSPSDSVTLESGPDVVVTLGKSKSPEAAATYDASGKFGSPASTGSDRDDASGDAGAPSAATTSVPAANDPSADAPADDAAA